MLAHTGAPAPHILYTYTHANMLTYVYSIQKYLGTSKSFKSLTNSQKPFIEVQLLQGTAHTFDVGSLTSLDIHFLRREYPWTGSGVSITH